MKNKHEIIICKLPMQNNICNKLTILNGRGSEKETKNCNKPRSMLSKKLYYFTILYELLTSDMQNIQKQNLLKAVIFTKFMVDFLKSASKRVVISVCVITTFFIRINY